MRMWRCQNQNDDKGYNSLIGKNGYSWVSSARGERIWSLYMESDKEVNCDILHEDYIMKDKLHEILILLNHFLLETLLKHFEKHMICFISYFYVLLDLQQLLLSKQLTKNFFLYLHINHIMSMSAYFSNLLWRVHLRQMLHLRVFLKAVWGGEDVP